MNRVLFLHASIPNYVADGIFHGLRQLEQFEVVDIPRHDVMYKNATKAMLDKTGSRGGCLYGRLDLEHDVIASSRVFWQRELSGYNFVIISDPHHCFHYLAILKKGLGKNWISKILWIDGSDSVSAFPFTSKAAFSQFWHRALYPILFFPYFKREFLSWAALLGIDRNNRVKILHKIFSGRGRIKKISISVPDDYIRVIPFAEKDLDWFPLTPDPEMKILIPELQPMFLGQRQFVITNHIEYERLLNRSKFGIVCKRAGWDSLRVYEYAARGVIICFKNLHLKPANCPPYGLDESNCIPYTTGESLLQSIEAMSDENLISIQNNAYLWLKQYTTFQMALHVLEEMTKKEMIL